MKTPYRARKTSRVGDLLTGPEGAVLLAVRGQAHFLAISLLGIARRYEPKNKPVPGGP